MQFPSSARRITLNDLPRWSSWPGRIFGVDPWKGSARTIQKIDAEYDKDKYSACFSYFRSRKSADAAAVKAWEMQASETETCISLEDELAVVSAKEAAAMHDRFLLETVGPFVEQADTVVELGCGYGYNLWLLSRHFPGKTYRGGEYSAQAVALAGELYRNEPSVRVEPFNFYDASYPILDALPRGRTLVFTRHAIEQLPSAASVVAALGKYGDRIGQVLHLEPIYETGDKTLFSLLRRRYTEMNDYNRDLLSLLQGTEGVDLNGIARNLFGHNPLNSTSVISWRCTRS
jgi:hypothetical protein